MAPSAARRSAAAAAAVLLLAAGGAAAPDQFLAVKSASEWLQCCPGVEYTDPARDGCYTCLCPASGITTEAVCWRDWKAVCVPGSDSEHCVIGSAFRLPNGDMCTCPPSGLKKNALCVSFTCETKLATEAVSGDFCEPGKAFLAEDQCNTCICPASGLLSGAGCTLKACKTGSLRAAAEGGPSNGFRMKDTPVVPGHEGTANTQGGGEAEVTTEDVQELHTTQPSSFTEDEGEVAEDEDQVLPGGSAASPQEAFPTENRAPGPRVFAPGEAQGPGAVEPAQEEPLTENRAPGPKVRAPTEASGTRTTEPSARGTSSASSGAASDLCCPGSVFLSDDGCNSCICAVSGLKSESTCTRMACAPWMKSTDKCTPHVPFPAGDGINTCMCTRSGRKSQAKCTEYPCPMKRHTEGGTSCCPGAIFMADDGCNTCTCAFSGKKDESTCTKRECNATTVPEVPAGRCVTGSWFPAGDGINSCLCTDGMLSKSICTNTACPVAPVAEQEGLCCPGLSYTAEDGCNTCLCPPSGQKSESLCTRMACPTLPNFQLPAGRCVRGVSYPAGDGLNTCTCPRSGWKKDATCTRMRCPTPPANASHEDKPGSGGADFCCRGTLFTADDGCNTCLCPASGQRSEAKCTKMRCLLPPPDAERCVPLVAFPKGDGVNTCMCPKSGIRSDASCTHLQCPVASTPPAGGTGSGGSPTGGDDKDKDGDDDTQGEPGGADADDFCCRGTLFTADDGCNTCVCPDSGLRSQARCTKMRCFGPPPNKERCVPFVAFPKGDGVNTCMCPRSGRRSDARCTRFRCPF